MRIGFIGLGNMGVHMARNLLKRDVNLVVYDMDASKMDILKAEGAEKAKNPAEIAIQCKEIVTMLPNSSHVKSVFQDAFGILDTLQEDTLCMDCSTIDQSASISVSELVNRKSANYIDAPVSGGVLGAKDGTLTFMVGGDEKSVERARPILGLMGKRTVHCGKIGSGQAAKICNNMLLGAQMVALAETMNLGIRMGLEPKTLAAVINTSSGRCWASDTYNPVPGIIPGTPSNADYNGGFTSALMAKDLGLAQNSSTRLSAPTPMGSLAHQLFLLLAKEPRFANKDFSVIYKFFQESAKV